MKIILSRKGFDASHGRYPSPILPNRRLISLPIPSNDCQIQYSDLKWENDKTYYDLINSLNIKNIKKNSVCHLDPDIYRDVRKRKVGWKGAFGQIGAAQSHLKNQGIGIGDLFLFFGWFKHVEQEENGKLSYNGSDLHVIFGYLQIGEIINDLVETKVPYWLKEHPHCSSNRRTINTNTIYISRDRLSFNEDYLGYGVFDHNSCLVLTKKECSRSKWNLLDIFREVRISYHTKNNWKDDYFQSASIGQEFVIEENNEIENWAKNLLIDNLKSP
jgi:hypothetical protein